MRLRRAIDIVVAFLLLALAAPVLAIAALAVKLSSRGPVIYSGRRAGKGGRVFGMYKFRTMVTGADALGPGVTVRNDPRVTPVGRFLRATKIDELPQLVNVLKGDMTLVGPRPEDPRFVEHYSPEQRRLLEVRPGMTGPAQLHYTVEEEKRIVDVKDAEEIYVEELLDRKLELDLAYLRTRTPARDLLVFLETAGFVLAGVARAARAAGVSKTRA